MIPFHPSGSKPNHKLNLRNSTFVSWTESAHGCWVHNICPLLHHHGGLDGQLKLMLLVLYLWMIQIHYCNPIFSEHSPQELASLSVV